MEGPRAPKQEEWPSVVDFLTKTLRPGLTWTLEEEYPSALNQQNLKNIRIVKSKNNDILSSAVMKPFLVKSLIGVLKVAGIGSVVTAENYRGQGLSGQILNSCLEAARQDVCDFAILWTDLFDFYRKLGFELAGTEISLILQKPLAPTVSLRIVEGSQIDASALLRLYGQHPCGGFRNEEDIRRHLKIPQSRVYTAWDANNQLKAYAVEGKGADLQGYVHEWGGDTQALIALIAHMQRKHTGSSLVIMTPPSAENLRRSLIAQGAREYQGILGMIKILSPVAFYGKILRYARSIGFEDFRIEEINGITTFGCGLETYSTDNQSDIVRMIFGPQKASTLHSFDPHTAKILDQIFPIPFWLWGWDSI